MGNLILDYQFISEIKSNEDNKVPASIGDPSYILPEYSLVNTMIQFNEVEILNQSTIFEFKIYNLLDKKYQYPGYADIDYSGTGRSFTLSAKTSF